jgi:hypothetical protein
LLPSPCLKFFFLDTGWRRVQQAIEVINGKTDKFFLYFKSFQTAVTHESISGKMGQQM